MSTRNWSWLLFGLSLGVVAAEPALPTPRIAVLYSAWGNYAFRHELDPTLKSLGWTGELFENTRVADLVRRLGEFDMVVSTGVGNYEKPQDMAPYRDQWLAFLQRGGCLLITDASYDSVLGKWVCTLGDDFRLSSQTCVAHTRPGPDTRTIELAAHPILTVPNDLQPILRRQSNIWAHLDSWGAGWQSLVTCRDGKSLFVVRPVGQGLLVVTSFYKFLAENGRVFGTALLENTLAAARQGRSGLQVTQLAFGPLAPGATTATLAVYNTTAQAMSIRGSVAVVVDGLAERAGDPVAADVPAGGRATLVLPYSVAQRGPQTLRVAVRDAAAAPLLAWSRRVEVPPAVAIELRRKHLYPHQLNLQGEVRLSPDNGVAPAALRLQYVVDGTPVSETSGAEEARPFDLPVPRAAVGPHRLEVTLRAGDRTLGTAAEEFHRHPAARVGVRADGVTLVDGKPFFPFGFYHVSWSFDAAHRQRMLRDCAEAGFNTVHVGIKQGEAESFREFLDEAERLDVHVVLEFGLPMFEIAERYKDHPAILCWNPGDEPDGGGVAPVEMFRRYDRFKQVDPGHLVYTTLCVPSEYPYYVRGTDVAAPDPYPVPHSPIRTVYDTLRQARLEAARFDTTVWGILQCFGNYGGWTRPPTPAELRAMTYLGLVAGVRGIVYYTYADPQWDVTRDAALWEAARALPREIERLTPALLDGRFSLLAEGERGLYAAGWQKGNVQTVALVNPGTEPAEFDLPVTGKAVEAPFGGTAPALAEGHLRGTLGPLETLVLEVR